MLPDSSPGLAIELPPLESGNVYSVTRRRRQSTPFETCVRFRASNHAGGDGKPSRGDCRPRLGRIGASVLCLLAVCLALSPLHALTPEEVGPEYRNKARFLANFPVFIEWPGDAFPDAHAPFVLGVIGDFRFGTSLAEAVQGASAHGHPVVIRWIKNEKELRSCHLLFVSSSEEKRYAKILEAVSGGSVLTVGESQAFMDAGGAIFFFPDGGGLRFEVNLSATQRARLKLSSHLLARARRVVRNPSNTTL